MKIKEFIIVLFFLLSSIVSFGKLTLPHGYHYVFPAFGAKHVHPGSTIIVRFNNISPQELLNLDTVIELEGEKNRTYSGKTIIASDNQTIIFTPEQNYQLGEEIKVSINPKLFSEQVDIEPLSYVFTVLKTTPSDNVQEDTKKESSLKEKSVTTVNKGPRIMGNGVSVPGDFPYVNITVNNNPSSEYIFVNNWDPPNYSVIFNTSGDPVYYWKTKDRRGDFKVQPNDWITMSVSNGFGGTGTGYIALDQNFQFIKSMRATNGYNTDDHELIMLPDNGYLLIGQRETIVDMTQYVEGGNPSAMVIETCIQEFTAEDQLIFIWRAWDHYDIRDLELDDLTGGLIRFPHMNAIYIDDDGHILLSNRHLSEISKINRQNGEFIWRMCGIPNSPNNEFQFINDPLNGFRNQHSIRSLGNGRFTIFDNGVLHEPPVSRAVEYKVDENQKTATLVWEYRNDLSSDAIPYMGNSHELLNGNTHINWAGGDMPIASEVTPDGEKIFEMWFEKKSDCYRTFRHPWDGKCPVPYLLLEPQVDNLTLIINKFGDDQVDYYNIYGGTSPNPTTKIDTSKNTLKQLLGLENGMLYYFRVTAVYLNGEESAYSNEESINVNITPPENNLIKNGEFNNALDFWDWEVSNSAEAEGQVNDNVFNFTIQNGGNEYRDVQLKQNNILLVQGQKYILEFDAWANGSRIVEIELEGDDPPHDIYSKIGYIALSSDRKQFSYNFVMQESTDNNARIVINAGGSDKNIYVDNLSLKIDDPTGINDPILKGNEFMLYQNYPNPSSTSTKVEYYLPETSIVKLTIHNHIGQSIGTYIDTKQSAGRYLKEIQTDKFISGIYFYTIEAKAVYSSKCYKKTLKMIVSK